MPKDRAISFQSSAAEDWEFDEEGNVLGPGNQWNSTFVAKALRAKGYRVEEPQNHEDYGWEFGCSMNGDAFWLVIAMGPNEGENYLWVKKFGFFKRLFGSEATRDALIAELQSVLNSDPHFSKVHEAHV